VLLVLSGWLSNFGLEVKAKKIGGAVAADAAVMFLFLQHL
jgi:hypothetical protein